jgi:hypothetical protein
MLRNARWEEARRFEASARQLFKSQCGRVEALLAESAKRLTPFQDPLVTDFGLHRWLAGDREEAYSDWLQWILLQIESPADLFQILGVESLPPGLLEWRQGRPSVGREFPVPRGHAGHAGRLDLWVRYNGQALVVVEIKKADAEGADTRKQAGYKAWLDAQPEPHKFAILIATEAEENHYEGFGFLSWADLCLAMRRFARSLCGKRRLMVATMTLAFAGAVEQNLLNLSAPIAGVFSKGAANTRVVAYLERWVSELPL